VENLTSGSVSLHDYQLSPADLRKMTQADLIVVNGLGLEAFLEKAMQNAGPSLASKVVTLSAGLHAELLEGECRHEHHEHSANVSGEDAHHHPTDPHIWLDPQLAAHCVKVLAAALQKADAPRAEGYAKNAEAYLQRLGKLDAEIKALLAPVRGVPFVTYHNAFQYFARRYELNLAGVVEQTAEISPSARGMSRLLASIREKNSRALFTEPGGGTRLARQIARDTGIRLGELDPLETSQTGRLAPASYEEGLRRNAKNLADNLLPALQP